MNAQIIRKFNNKKQAHNPKAFEAAYQRIQISSKRCYIATECFGENDPRTETLRCFKSRISPYELGRDFIDFYYLFSPRFLTFTAKHRFVKKTLEFLIIKPTLTIFVLFIGPYVHHKKTHS